MPHPSGLGLAVPVCPHRAQTRVVGRVLPALRRLERFIRPRLTTPFQATKRVVGGGVMVLAVALLAPVPPSNVPLAIALIAFAHLEEDGVLLCTVLAAAVVMLSIAAAAWETLGTTGRAPGFL